VVSASLIVADAGPLIALGKIGELALLKSLFQEIHLPTRVLHEATDNIALGGAIAVRDFAQAHVRVHEDRNDEFVQLVRIEIDEGEAQAIALAKSLGCGVLMDDHLGREAAKRASIPVIGLAGVLLLGKREGMIDSVQSRLLALSAANYHLSQTLIAEIIRLAEE
jgi:predicted nucleic acid-binding protein